MPARLPSASSLGLPLPCGVVLTGGRSRRMGRDKALLALEDGRCMAAWVIERLVRACEPVFAIDPNPGRLAALGVTVVADRVPARGPLGGLATALEISPKPWVFVVGCDMPRIHPELVGGLMSLTAGVDAVVPVVGGRRQTLAALYSTRLSARASALLASGSHGLSELLDEARVRWVSEDEARAVDPSLESFTNVNTPADLAAIGGERRT